MQSQGTENPGNFSGFGQVDLGLLLDFEMLADFGGRIELGGAARPLGWSFIGQCGRKVVSWALIPESSSRMLDSDTDELAAAAEVAVGRVVESVEFVGARHNFASVKLL